MACCSNPRAACIECLTSISCLAASIHASVTSHHPLICLRSLITLWSWSGQCWFGNREGIRLLKTCFNYSQKCSLWPISSNPDKKTNSGTNSWKYKSLVLSYSCVNISQLIHTTFPEVWELQTLQTANYQPVHVLTSPQTGACLSGLAVASQRYKCSHEITIIYTYRQRHPVN